MSDAPWKYDDSDEDFEQLGPTGKLIASIVALIAFPFFMLFRLIVAFLALLIPALLVGSLMLAVMSPFIIIVYWIFR